MFNFLWCFLDLVILRILCFQANLSETMENDVVYEIPYQMIEAFGKVALLNKKDKNHIETLALIAGVWSGRHLIAKDLIFPKQNGSSSDVEDLGNSLIG